MRQLMVWLVGAALGGGVPLADRDIPIARVAVHAVGRVGQRLVIQVADLPAWGMGGRVILAQENEPLGWLDWMDGPEDGGTFISSADLDFEMTPAALRAWVIGPELAAHLRYAWPLGAELHARLDTVGLADRDAWIDAGASLGIRVGDCWWRRAAGQPVTRYDVRWVGSDLSYCRAVPLAADSRPRTGEPVTLWPAPGLQRTGGVIGAVSFVESGEDSQVVWVAGPPHVAAPPEPRLDFQRDGEYLGSGIAERRDARFWYVRILPGTAVAEIRVGDDAVVRTAADIRARRISARVFEVTPTGALLNAGEIDGLSVGDVGAVWRAGRLVGRVQLMKVQRGYSMARLFGESEALATRPVPQNDDGGIVATLDGLRTLDEVRFSPPATPPVRLGVVEHVADGTLFSARIEGAHVAELNRPLEVRRAGRTIGVAVLLEAADGRALGFAVARSLTARLAAGDTLMVSP
jgi:hypothetical protein